MMEADSSKCPAWLIIFVLLSLLVSAASSSAEGKNGSLPCVDGTYEHDGRTCCLCGAGLHLEEHCTTNLQYGKCKACDEGKYMSDPNKQDSCEPCTSCSPPNANLEVDKPCTRASNAKCRCKRDHYCSSGTETCRICYPCKECGTEGIKVACRAATNTVCNDKIEEGNNVGKIVGIIVAIVLVIGLALSVFFWKRRQSRKRQRTLVQLPNGSPTDVEMQRLRDVPVVDLQPHLPDIAEAIGWRDMQDIAMRSSIPNTTIDSCQLDHPGNSQEQTLQLLRIWVEKEGIEASKNLIQILQKSGKKGKAEKVMNMLSSTFGQVCL